MWYLVIKEWFCSAGIGKVLELCVGLSDIYINYLKGPKILKGGK